MSAFMVSNQTLSELANTISAYCIAGYNGFGFDFSGWIRSHFAMKSAKEIFDELTQMNIDSLSQRYPKDYKEMVGELEYIPTADLWSPRHLGVQQWHYQLLMSLQCYLYQCCEGDVPERELFKELSKSKNGIMEFIVCHQPEYQKAEWR